MIKRIIEVSREPAHISVSLDQLVIQPADSDKTKARSFPYEDIGFLVIDHPQVTMTAPALSAIMDHGGAVVVCGKNHIPNGVLAPVPSHTNVVWRIEDQIQASKPLKKKLWQQIVSAKIIAQAKVLTPESASQARLQHMARQVKSGDPDNLEGQAARIYWSSWLDDTPCSNSQPIAPPEPNTDESGTQTHARFNRDQDATDPLNLHLNYGYAILRAGVARALVSAGLFPAIGLFHRNRSNSFVLADDVMEPLRPMVDTRVRNLIRLKRTVLDQPNKAILLGVLHATVTIDGQQGPLMVALHRYAASLTRCYSGQSTELLIPESD